ncbi:zn 2cys6 transcription factor [Colletotrichum incanum]|uniref:Zn 2cys6 transcription factor n=1 Tax=Colletotrichum incanum TaxID=1573173 RepID=A0A166ZND7_COLIC|nr:zn 2cys6 transcription factor [Colletotrichum incanum]
MAHCFNTNSNIPFSWAGQAADDPFGQKWLPNSDLSAPPTGRAGLLSTDAPRNDESLIKDFNDELPDHDAQEDALGQSSWLLINGALSDHTDLPFDLVIDNDIELDAARPVSYEIARTSSQASSTGIDEESIGFSNADDLYDIGFSAGCGDDILNGINSPGTSFSDVNLSTNPSLENSPVSPRCPFLSMQAGNSGSDISSRNATSAPQSYIAANANSSFPDFGSARTPRSAPRHNVSALSTELAGQSQYQAIDSSPSSEYFERWSSRAGDDGMESVDLAMWDDSSLSENFVPYIQSQLGPSFVIVPPETPDVTMRDSNDLTASEMYRPSETHPIDYYLSANYAATQLTEPRSVPSMPIPQASTTNTPNRLSVPHRRRRRTSDPVHMNAHSRAHSSASRLQPIMSGAGFMSPRGSPAQNARARISSPLESTRFQRVRPTEPTRISGATLPMPIASRPGRLSSTGQSPDSQMMMARPGRPAPARGRRHGPMDPVSRGQAKETRNRKMVCIRCKHSKQKCKRDDDSLDGSCIGCDRHGGSQRWPGPCVKAHFEDLVLSGSCNYVSSHAIYHPTLDHATRIRRELPKQIHLDELMARLDRARLQFNFKVHQDGQPLYVLDLDSCHEYLQGLRQQMDSAEYSFPTFIDREILRTDTRNDDWERCMTQTTTPWGDWLSLLCDVNKMPSRASFSYVSKPYYTAPGAGVEQPINVEDPNEADNLMLAAQLSRIICRKLEVKAYQHLQRLLHESGTMEDDKVLPFLQSLGRILLTLRWRLSWWTAVPEVVGMSDQDEDAGRRQVELRVHALCRVLYFYYCCVRRRPSVWPNLKALSGIHSKYPDTETEVWDDFPGDESVEGFGAWMDRGRELVVEAGVVNRLRSMGLAA